MKAGSKRLAILAAGAVIIGGCSFAGGGRGWVAQGPGDIPEAREAPRRAAPPAEQPRAASVGATRQGAGAAAADPPANSGAYTQASRYGDLLFVSGQIAIDSRSNMVGDKVEDQTRQVMENIRQILEAHRLTMANVVSVTVYLKDLTQFRAMDDVYETYFRSALPARSVVEVSKLPRGALVEIAVVAGR